MERARQPLQVLLVVPDLADNSVGRGFCLWLLIRQLGWTATVVSVRGDELWAPLRDGGFAADCRRIPDGPHQHEELRDLARAADLLIAVKPKPGSMEVVLRLAEETGTGYLVDLDDPDFDGPLSVGRPLKQAAKFALRPRLMASTLRMRQLYEKVPEQRRIVSNPVLHSRYGGTLIPHVRAVTEPGSAHTSASPVVSFVGTARRHKGLALLRAAVAAKAADGYRLVITDRAPADARPWEEWIGPTTMSEGRQRVATSDVVVLPSSDDPASRGQLPVKLIDAMMLGRAIAVSDVEPMPWAVADGGRVLAATSVPDIVATLDDFADPAVRRCLGERARERFLAEFSVEANEAAFESVCRMGR